MQIIFDEYLHTFNQPIHSATFAHHVRCAQVMFVFFIAVVPCSAQVWMSGMPNVAATGDCGNKQNTQAQAS
jgi:hypothetical protein